MHQTKGGVEIRTGAEHAVMSPDRNIICFHQFGGLYADGTSAGNHPRNHADTGGEDNRTFRHHFPDLTGENFIRKRKDEGQCDGIDGMAVIDHTMGTIRHTEFDFVIHQMCGDLTGGTAAIFQTPANTVIGAGFIQFDNTKGFSRFTNDILEITAGSGDQEIFTAKQRNFGLGADPFAGNQVLFDGFDFFRTDTIGKVSTVTLVPAFLPAIFCHLNKAFDKFCI